MSKLDTDRLFYVIDEYLDVLDTHEHDRKGAMGGPKFPPFRGLWPMAVTELMAEDDSAYRIKPDATLNEIDGRLNTSTVIRNTVSDRPDHENEIVLRKVREVPLSAVRGKVKKFAKTIIESSYCVVNMKTRKSFGGIDYFGSNDRSSFIELPLNFDATRMIITSGTPTIAVSMAPGVQLLQEGFWTVDFQVDLESPSIRLPCGSEGIKQLLKDRNIPMGKKRRQYLKTWVSEHMRQLAKDEVLVKQHLRGRQIVECAGYQCEIHAPLAEVREVEQRYGVQTPKSVRAEIQQLEDAQRDA